MDKPLFFRDITCDSNNKKWSTVYTTDPNDSGILTYHNRTLLGNSGNYRCQLTDNDRSNSGYFDDLSIIDPEILNKDAISIYYYRYVKCDEYNNKWSYLYETYPLNIHAFTFYNRTLLSSN